MTIEFEAFPKIARLKRSIYITEKLDGTNACVVIDEDGSIGAQSRNRLITPLDDNYGFAKWVDANAADLKQMGPGHHFGEWWGAGVGPRGYGLTEKRFSLFNVNRWNNDLNHKPACCHVVPTVLDAGDFTSVDLALGLLREKGSFAAPGFMSPEGIIVYHSASRNYYKVLLDNDDVPKSLAA